MTTKKQLSAEISSFLLAEGLMSDGEKCDCRLIPSRQAAAHVVLDESRSFFVKKMYQDHSVGDGWLDRNNLHSSMHIASHRPKVLANKSNWLVTEYFQNAGTLKDVPSRQLTEPTARAIGSCLAQFHRATVSLVDKIPGLNNGGATPQNRVRPVYPLTLEDYANTPGLDRDIFLRASQRCSAGVQSLTNQLATLCAVHGDLQGGNILLGQQDTELFHIVDWESAGVGDPTWDLGHLLAALLRRWLSDANIKGAGITAILESRETEWNTLSNWYTLLFHAYHANAPEAILSLLDTRKIYRVAGHAILQRSRNILHVRGQFSQRDILQLSIAEKLMASPADAAEILTPNLKIRGSQ